MKAQWAGMSSTFSHMPGAYGSLWHPALATGIAAGIIAPWLLKNDDRGYGKTALVTTPLLTAGMLAAPGMFGGIKSAGSSAARAWQARPFTPFWNGDKFDMSYKSLADLQVLREKGGLSESEFTHFAEVARQADLRKAQREAATLRSNRPLNQIKGLKESVGNLWEKRMAGVKDNDILTQSFTLDMNAAFEEARLAAGLKPQGIGARDATSLFAAMQHEFGGLTGEASTRAYRSMRRRLTMANKRVVGAKISPDGVPMSQGFEFHAFSDTEGTERLLQDSLGSDVGSEMMANLRAAVSRQAVDDISIAMSKGKAVGLRVRRAGEGEAAFGFVDMATGRSLRGKALEQEAAARLVRTGGDTHSRLDLWLTRNLHQPMSLINDEIDTHLLHSDISDDLWALENQPDRAGSLMPKEVMWLRSQELAPSQFAVFNGKHFKDLNYEERVAEERAFAKVGAYFGNEHGAAIGIGQLRSLETFLPGLAGTERKNDPWLRGATKSARIDPNSVPEHLRAFYTNEKQAELFKDGASEVGLTLGQLTPTQVALFGELPENAKDLKGFSSRAIELIKEDLMLGQNMTDTTQQRAAERTWKRMRKHFERNPLALQDARKMGSMGETQFMLHNDFSQVVMHEGAVAHVKDLHLNTAPGGIFGANTVIGFDASGAEVVSPANGNVLHSVRRTEDGWMVRYLREYSVQTGSKIDALGKGLVIGTRKGEFERNIKTLNLMYSGAYGRAPVFGPEVNALANSMYVSTKESSVLGTLGQAHDIMRRLDRIGADDIDGNSITQPFREQFKQWHVDMGDTIRERTGEALSAMEAESASKGVSLAQLKQNRLLELNRINEELMAKATHFIRWNPKQAGQDSLFYGYLNMTDVGTKLQGNYTLRAHSERFAGRVGQATIWDSTLKDVPRQVSVTFDMYSNMLRNGDDPMFKEILSNAQGLHGDTQEAYQWAQHFFGGKKEALGSVFKLDEVQDPKTLFSGEGAYAKNFSLDLGREMGFKLDGKEFRTRYLPVLGGDSYKGASNTFGAGETALTKYQSSLTSVIQAAKTGDEARFAGAMGRHAEAAAANLFGKAGCSDRPKVSRTPCPW
jgi:hypothetical protein